jgi:hypothetical protein
MGARFSRHKLSENEKKNRRGIISDAALEFFRNRERSIQQNICAFFPRLVKTSESPSSTQYEGCLLLVRRSSENTAKQVDTITAYGGALLEVNTTHVMYGFEGNSQTYCGSRWLCKAIHGAQTMGTLRAVSAALELRNSTDSKVSFLVLPGKFDFVGEKGSKKCFVSNESAGKVEFGKPGSIKIVENEIFTTETHQYFIVEEGNVVQLNKDYHSYPTVKDAVTPLQADSALLASAKEFIPESTYQRLRAGTVKYSNELRFITCAHIYLREALPLDAMQEFVLSIQKHCYLNEGQLVSISDQGKIFQCVFGLPPFIHKDDLCRCIIACNSIIAEIGSKLAMKVGIATGEVVCEIYGGQFQAQSVIVGNTIEASLKLATDPVNNTGILCDAATAQLGNKGLFEFVEIKKDLLFIPKRRSNVELQSLPEGSIPISELKEWNPVKFSTQYSQTTQDMIGGILVLEGKVGLGQKELSLSIAKSIKDVIFVKVEDDGMTGDNLVMTFCKHLVSSFKQKYPNSLTEVERIVGGRSMEELEVAVSLMKYVLLKNPICLALEISLGTSVKEASKSHSVFWGLFDAAGFVVHQLPLDYPHKMTVILSNSTGRVPSPEESQFYSLARTSNTIIQMESFDETLTKNFLSQLFRIDSKNLDEKLLHFFHFMSNGFPQFIEELITGLKREGIIEISDGSIKTLKSLSSVDFIKWRRTWVAGTIIQKIESLDAFTSAVLKIAASFDGAFTLADVESSLSSRFCKEGSLMVTCQLWRSFNKLIELGFFIICQPVESHDNSAQTGSVISGSSYYYRSQSYLNSLGGIERYRIDQPLVRQLAVATLINKERVRARRQGLIERVLNKVLRDRMISKRIEDEQRLGYRYVDLVDIS